MIGRVATAMALAFLSSPAAATGVGVDAGAKQYAEHCAICHGAAAKGDGPLAELLIAPPPDLTGLSARNGGTFPEERVYRTIDGRADIRAHGTRAMPAWGSAFRAKAEEAADPSTGPVNPENVVTARILSLVRYLESIQE